MSPLDVSVAARPILDFGALARASVFDEPFHFLIAEHLVRPEVLDAVCAEFPKIDHPGLFPLSALSYGPHFADLIDEMLGQRFAEAIGAALGVSLAGRPSMVLVRSQCRETDGTIHTDSRDKLVSALLYLNREWTGVGGRLRFLRDGYDLGAVVAEVAPSAGTFVAFRRSDNSWHGHKPYVGRRCAIMLNWMADEAAARREILRHRVSARAKTLAGWFG